MTKNSLHRRRSHLLEYSPWILGVAWMLLVALLVFFAVSNYRREKEIISMSLHQRGLSIVRFVDLTVREQIRRDMRDKESVVWQDSIQAALNLASEQPGVLSVKVVDPEVQKVVAAASASKESRADSEALSSVEKMMIQQMKSLRGETSLLEVVKEGGEKHFLVAANHRVPFGMGPDGQGMHGMGHGRMSMRMWSADGKGNSEMFRQLRQLAAHRPILLVDLDYGDFTAPLQRQFVQILLQLIVIVLVGIGGVLAFYAVRSFKKSEERAAGILSFLERMVAMLPVGLLATDKDGTIRIANEATREILHCNEDALLGKNSKNALDGRLESAIETDGQILYSSEAGEKKLLLVSRSFAPTETETELPGQVIVLQDRTEVNQLERELQRSEKLAAVGKMAAGVAHEIRNPLSSIKGLALLLKSRFADGSVEEKQVHTMINEIERLNRSIGELLDFSRPANLQKSRVDVVSLLERTAVLFEPDLQAAGATLQIEFPYEDKEIIAHADEDKLNQVFLNLILNSIQAFEDWNGKKEIVVRLEKTEPGLTLRIIDSGPGISAENLKNVLDPYFTTKSDGTGLGLALSAKIIEEHGGTLRPESVPGQGCEIVISLP